MGVSCALTREKGERNHSYFCVIFVPEVRLSFLIHINQGFRESFYLQSKMSSGYYFDVSSNVFSTHVYTFSACIIVTNAN